MVIMDAYYPPNRLQETWQKINQLHLSYLEMEESPEKLDHRNILEDCIREFLCMAAHSQKFFLGETADILYRSASSKKDFSGYKAATGWNAIQMYAGNLLSQPWRKEYRQVKTYCGFYKHQIEANLVGAEIMFEAMGYKHCSNGILVLEGPICPDTVTGVSKDCLIAYVECQILKAIWEEITPTFKISWLDVLEFRKAHLCNIEQSITALTYQCHQKQYQAQNSELYSNRYPQTNISLLVSNPPLTAHNHLPISGLQQLPYIYDTNHCCSNNYSTYTHVPYGVPMHYPQHVIKTPYTNGYYCANGILGQPHSVCGYTVPTGQLIELDSNHNGAYEIVDRSINLKVTKNFLAQDAKKNNETKIRNTEKEHVKEDSHFEDWDYVYRDLESQGYSKDLGERGDILSPPMTQKRNPTNLDEAINCLTVSDRPLKIDETLNKFECKLEPVKKIDEKKLSRSSSYENLTEPKKVLQKVSTTIKTLPSNEKHVGSVHENSRTMELAKSKPKKEKWECKACTYHNEDTKDVCDICSKSRNVIEQQMEIGGPQCSQCTLVNSKHMEKCQACGSSLKDSPTYI